MSANIYYVYIYIYICTHTYIYIYIYIYNTHTLLLYDIDTPGRRPAGRQQPGLLVRHVLLQVDAQARVRRRGGRGLRLEVSSKRKASHVGSCRVVLHHAVLYHGLYPT